MNVQHRPAPIVVAAFTAYCDHADHEVEVVTDGLRVASRSAGAAGTGPVDRQGAYFTLYCPRVLRNDEPCPGSLTVNQGDHTAWRAATPEDASWLDTDAQEVDHA